MANNRIQVKRTNIRGRLPNTTNSSNSSYIAAGEFALNMYDRQLYTSDGTNLITIGSSGGSLTLSDSLRIGDIATDLLAINSTAVFTGNLYTNTTINTTSISVQNSSSNSSLSPSTIYVGNNAANIAIDVTGGIKTISLVSANISTTGIATIQTTVDHGISTLYQSKIILNTPLISLNTSNYSVDYNNGFNITNIPTGNTVSFTVPTDSFKFKWGDRTIASIVRDSTGLVTVATNGPHQYQNLDKAYVTNVSYSKAPFAVLDNANLPTATTINLIDAYTVSYLQSQYNSAPISLIGATAYLYNSTVSNGNGTYNVYFEIRGLASAFSTFNVGDIITFANFPDNAITSYINAGTRIKISTFNGAFRITNISFNSPTITTIQILYTTRTLGANYYYFYDGTTNKVLVSGNIVIAFQETGTVTNLSQLCPVLPNTSISGTIYAKNPVGITIKNDSKVVYVFDSGVYVGNTTVGSVTDSSGSRTFNPSGTVG